MGRINVIIVTVLQIQLNMLDTIPERASRKACLFHVIKYPKGTRPKIPKGPAAVPKKK